MDFASLNFLFIFFPLFVIIWTIVQHEYRLGFLLAASLVFICAGHSASLPVLLGIALLGYLLGRDIEKIKMQKKNASIWMLFGIMLLVGLLLYQKALSTDVVDVNKTNLSNFFPVLGLSFVSFQAISYIIDITRGTIPPETNFWKFLTYILFFPKLASGPIVRYKQFRDQVENWTLNWEQIANGIRRILGGVIKRLLIANQLGIVVDAVFNLPTPNIEPLFAWIALIAYTFQIYYDFSGYTDIAIGLGKIIGVNLPENFNYPYTAMSIGDFWRRWHITLSMWFREYVFYPLERRRLRFSNQPINLILVFLLTGLWHGISINFLIWGGIHGVAIALESLGGGRWVKSIWRPFRHLITILVVMLSWVFFRSSTSDYAFGFIGRLFGNATGLQTLPFTITKPFPLIEPTFLLILLFAFIFSFPVTTILRTIYQRTESNPFISIPLQLIGDVVVVVLFLLAIASQLSGSFQPGIYANF